MNNIKTSEVSGRITNARDLFAGLGWSFALQNLGIEDHGVEWDDAVREARNRNGFRTIARDVRSVQGGDGRYALELGSPPCERFTRTGRGDGVKAREDIIRVVRDTKNVRDIADGIAALGQRYDEKIGMVLEPLRVLMENPHAQAAIWEQVPTVLPIWQAAANLLREHGWLVDVANVSAEWYGVPQDRRRAILLARRDGVEACIPRKGSTPRRVLIDVFPDRHGWIQRSNYSAPATAERRTAKERGRTLRTMNEASVTMTRKAAQWIHPDGGITKMTVADMALVQTFPESAVFQGGVMEQRLQVGNAVPVKMAEALIRAAL